MKHTLRSLWARLATPTPRGQRGIALLLTLGILSLLLVLAMSFAYSTRTERMAAGNNADLVKARLLAESGLERAMALLRFSATSSNDDKAYYPGTNTAYFKSPSSGDWQGRRYMFSYDATSNDTTDIDSGLAVNFTSTDGTYALTPSDSTLGATWMHIADSNGNMFGRIAYVVIDQGGMIDPGAVVSTGTAESPTSVIRTGADPTEIQLKDLASAPGATTLINGGSANQLRDLAFSSTSASFPGVTFYRWFSLPHIAKSTVLNNTAAADRANQWSVFTQALFPWSHDTDKYRLTPTSTDERSRYNLANTGSATVANLTSSGTDGIPWLANLSPASAREQVAANLIDYCDSDSIATAGPSIPSNITYVGLERVPYIYRIEVDAVLSMTGTDTRLDITTRCGLVNMYSSTSGTEPAPSPNLQVKIVFDHSNWPNAIGPFTYSWNGPVGYNSDIKTDWTYTSTAAGAYNPAISIKSIAITESNSSAFPDPNVNHLWDYATITPTSAHNTDFSGSLTQSVIIQAKDPRCNTNTGDWTWSNSGVWSDTVSMSNPNPSTGPDLETSSDVKSGVSTAYIRNEPMKSLWELGAIHRGEPWETLNLSTTSTGTPSYDYTHGDANILDQVYIPTPSSTSATDPVRGRFNANSPQTEAWACFLAGVTAGATYDTPEGGTALTNGGAGGGDLKNSYKLGEKICEVNGTVSGSVPFTNRGAIALCTELSNTGSAIISPKPMTDRAREEIIGKIAGLLTVRSNYFTAIVTAQAVKDMPGLKGKTPAELSDRPSTWVEYNTTSHSWCNVLAEQKILAVVFRDALTNKFAIESFEYLEE